MPKSVALGLLALLSSVGPAQAGPRRVRVAFSYNEPIYLPGELRDIASAIGGFLSRHGDQVVPIAELDRLARIASEGRNLSTDQACGVPAPAMALDAVPFPDLYLATAEVTCDHGCKLTVEDDVDWQVSLPKHPTPAQVIAAVPRLKRYHPQIAEGGMSGVLGGMGYTPPPTGIELSNLDQDGAWTTDPRRALETQRLAIDPCLTDVQRAMVRNGLVLDIDRSGKVLSCDPEHDDELPVDGFACVCQAVRKVDFGHASGDRRLRFDLIHHPVRPLRPDGKVTTVHLEELSSLDASATSAQTGVSPGAIAACVPADRPIPDSWQKLSVLWRIDANGRPTHVDATLPGAPPQVQKCVEAALGAAAFSCPQRGGEVGVSATLSIYESVPY